MLKIRATRILSKFKETFSFLVQKQREITAGVPAIGVSKDLIVTTPSAEGA